jgi:threonine dehydratase
MGCAGNWHWTDVRGAGSVVGMTTVGTLPTFADILRAADLLAGVLPPTPMWHYPALDAVAGATVYVKHENAQPVGAFKVRGGLVLLAGMPAEQRRRGIVAYSTGNHAQSLAYACAAYGAPCTVVMPERVSETKVRAVRALGATVRQEGADLVAAGAVAERIATAEDRTLVTPGDRPELIAGVGTTYLEILRAQPGLDAIVVPIGAGTGAASATLVTAALSPSTRVVGVQSEASPAGHDSWRAGELVTRPDRTAIEGVATGRGFALPQQLLRGTLAEFHLVADAQVRQAQRLLASHAHTLAEGAGAAALAAVLANRDDYAGRRIAVVCTGGNASPAELAALAG